MSGLSPVKAARPVAAYIGGKKVLSAHICARIATVAHETYAEPFVGMGGVFLRRQVRPRCEVINDLSGDVATFFRVLQNHPQAFGDMIRWQISGRAEFERLMGMDPDRMTDLQRAARFLYLQKLAFGGKVSGRNFGVSPGRAVGFDSVRLMAGLEDLHDRLSGVVIERLAWDAFVRRYDRPGTLFYLDPPYYGCEGDYGEALFSRDQFEAMAELLGAIKGRFILSLNDRPEVRAIFAAFDIESVRVRYTVSGAGGQQAGEVLISN